MPPDVVPPRDLPPAGDGPHRVLEPIEPAPGSFDPRAMARGEPGVPMRFRWRGRDYEVLEVLASEREIDGVGGAGAVGYVRRHAVTVRTRCGATMVLLGARSKRVGPARWTLREIVPPSAPG